MLFVIDNSIAEALSQPAPSDNIINAIQSIADAGRKGIHLIFAKRNTLGILRVQLSLSEPARRFYDDIYDNFVTIRDFPTMFICHIEVVAQTKTLEIDSQGRIIRLSADYISNSSITDKTIVLGENLSDVDLYKRITRVYLTQIKQNYLDLHYLPMGGGGSTTAPQYEIFQQERDRLCLAIVDNDIAAPTLKWGDTAKHIKKIDKEQEPFCKLLVLDVRMAENLLPTELYRQALPPKDKLQDTVEFMGRLEAINPEARQYVHFKNGLKLKEILSSSSESALVKYWQPILTQLNCSFSCWETPCPKKEDCKCYLIPNFGPQILNTATKFIANQSDLQLAKLIYEPLKSEWHRIGQHMAAWCCGTPPKSAL